MIGRLILPKIQAGGAVVDEAGRMVLGTQGLRARKAGSVALVADRGVKTKWKRRDLWSVDAAATFRTL